MAITFLRPGCPLVDHRRLTPPLDFFLGKLALLPSAGLVRNWGRWDVWGLGFQRWASLTDDSRWKAAASTGKLWEYNVLYTIGTPRWWTSISRLFLPNQSRIVILFRFVVRPWVRWNFTVASLFSNYQSSFISIGTLYHSNDARGKRLIVKHVLRETIYTVRPSRRPFSLPLTLNLIRQFRTDEKLLNHDDSRRLLIDTPFLCWSLVSVTRRLVSVAFLKIERVCVDLSLAQLLPNIGKRKM